MAGCPCCQPGGSTRQPRPRTSTVPASAYPSPANTLLGRNRFPRDGQMKQPRLREGRELMGHHTAAMQQGWGSHSAITDTELICQGWKDAQTLFQAQWGSPPRPPVPACSCISPTDAQHSTSFVPLCFLLDSYLLRARTVTTSFLYP